MSPEEGIQARAKAAAEAWYRERGSRTAIGTHDWDALLRVLVALASDEARRERERIYALPWGDFLHTPMAKRIVAATQEARRQEREACAMIAQNDSAVYAGRDIAEAIRSRSASDPAEPERAMSRLKEALAREGEIVEGQEDCAQTETGPGPEGCVCSGGKMIHRTDGPCYVLPSWLQPGPTKEARPEPPPASEVIPRLKADIARSLGRHPAPEARVSPDPDYGLLDDGDSE